MMLEMTVVPNAKKNRVVLKEGRVKVYVKSKAQKGEANRELVSFLCSHFRNPKIISGHRGRSKTVHVDDEEEETTYILQRLAGLPPK